MPLQEITDQAQWDNFVSQHPLGHPLQFWAWGELKRINGWTAKRLAVTKDGQPVEGAQMLFWAIPHTHKKVAYIPRGPLSRPNNYQLLKQLAEVAQSEEAFYLKIEPSWISADMPSPWRPAKQQILLSETYTIDLTKSEDDLLAAMRHKTRQYIRKAGNEGVKIERGTDLADFWRIYQNTAKRAGFGLHAESYYQRLFEVYGDQNRLYYGMIDGRPEAFLWVLYGAGVALELYGGVTDTGAAKKANYLLKWQAISQAGQDGLKIYDFSGRLNEGVSQFKAGFGPDETNYVGSYDLPLNKAFYALWEQALPALKPIGRALLPKGRR